MPCHNSIFLDLHEKEKDSYCKVLRLSVALKELIG